MLIPTNTLQSGFSHLPKSENWEEDTAKIAEILETVATRLHNNYPYPHPLYAGQMLKPPHAIAQAAYFLAMQINPNNHALDGGKESSAMEKEVVADIAKMFGWQQHLGHLTSGGTMANLEALWVAGQLAEGKYVAASELAHYTHSRISGVLKIPFISIACDLKGKMDLQALEKALQTGEIGTVVATLGTTGMGTCEDLQGILALREKYAFRIHIDAAYGGYFTLAENLTEDVKASFQAISQADSIVIDPHKHGLQPYGCGCILFQNPEIGRLYAHDSPYTYFTSDALHLGEISLECSRAGAAAVALWATMQLFPLEKKGLFSQRLDASLTASRLLYEKIGQEKRFLRLISPTLDIVVWCVKGKSFSEISQLSKRLFIACEQQHLYLALFQFPAKLIDVHLYPEWKSVEKDAEHIVCLRSCLMKPEHLDWVERIWELLEKSIALE